MFACKHVCALYGYNMWFPAPREAHRLRMFKIGPKYLGLRGRKLHNEKLYHLYSLLNFISVIESRIKRAEYVACKRAEKCVRNLSESDGKRSFGRLSLGWEDHVKIHVREVACENAHWVYIEQHRDQSRALVNRVMNLPVP
jgi:hypothetical protein